MIRDDGIDILVDLSQHTARKRLPVFAGRPAPVQVSFAAYPESTGVDAINYRISDRWLEAGQEMSNDECRMTKEERMAKEGMPASGVFLLESFWCYDTGGVNLAVTELPARDRGSITFGCLNSPRKIDAPVLRLWSRVLRQVNNSRLVPMREEGSHRQRALDILEREGIDSQRVEFVNFRPRATYLETYRLMDLMLDTSPYNGHTTSLDALWMGIPVVSLAGERAVSRAGVSILNNLGLPELVAFSEDEFVTIAVKLATDRPRLAELRRTLRSRMEKSVLMDAPRFGRQIEAAFRAMWRDWCTQQEPSGR